MNLKIEINSFAMNELNVTLNRLAESTGKTLQEVLPSQMRLLATDLAYVTYPKGKGSADNVNHQAKIQGRIRDVYPRPGTIVNELKNKDTRLGVAFSLMLQKRQYSKAKQLTDRHLPNMGLSIGSFDGGELHKAQSEQKRVTKRLLVPLYTRVEAYTKKTMKMSGYAKGGFATASRQLGGVRGIPGWATRHRSPGTGTITGDGKTLTVTMINHVKYLSEFALQSYDERAAVSNRKRNITKLLDRIQTNKIKKLMRR
jgi:hypothetical protein